MLFIFVYTYCYVWDMLCVKLSFNIKCYVIVFYCLIMFHFYFLNLGEMLGYNIDIFKNGINYYRLLWGIIVREYLTYYMVGCVLIVVVLQR